MRLFPNSATWLFNIKETLPDYTLQRSRNPSTENYYVILKDWNDPIINDIFIASNDYSTKFKIKVGEYTFTYKVCGNTYGSRVLLNTPCTDKRKLLKYYYHMLRILTMHKYKIYLVAEDDYDSIGRFMSRLIYPLMQQYL